MRARAADGALSALGVPGVAPAVAVRVAEVVGLPRVRRDHDRDAASLAELGGADDEGGEADAAVVRGQLHEVDARTAHGPIGTVERRPAGRRAVQPIVHRLGHRHAVHQRVVVRRARPRGPARKICSESGARVGLDRERRRARRRRSSRRVKPASTPSTRTTGAVGRGRSRRSPRRTCAGCPRRRVTSSSVRYVRGAVVGSGLQLNTCRPGPKVAVFS